MSEQIKTVAEIAEELKTAADARDQSARLLGNVTAGEISRLCRWCLAARRALRRRAALAAMGEE